MRRAAGPILAAALTLAGCISGPTPSPTPSAPPRATVTPGGAAGTVLRFAIAGEPSGFLPPALDAGTARIQHFLYDALYRLDEQLRPQPDLAADPPSVSDDGLTWTIALRTGVSFSDGSTLAAVDVVTTYGLAMSAACPFAALCAVAHTNLAGVVVDTAGRVEFRLRAPFASLQAELLAQLPILPSAALTASVARLVAGAADMDPASLAGTVEGILAATTAETCLVPSPPLGCDPADHIDALMALAAAAHLAPLEGRRFVDDAGRPDRSAYGAALLAAARDLVTVLTSSDAEQLAAALPLLDLGAVPIGTGPYRLSRYEPGAFVELERRKPGRAGEPTRIRAVVMRDPTAAVTALLSGELDWLPDVAPEMASVLAGDPTVRVAARPSGTLRAIVFNVREGHPFADPFVREAFVRCLDRTALVSRATDGRGLPAASLVAPASWAFAPPPSPRADPAAARELLETAGFRVAADGIYARAGQRLSGEILVRPGRADLAALGAAMSVELRDCGIDLAVREGAFISQLILSQLEWPNAFDIFLAAIRTGSDPDIDLGWLAGAHVTGPANPGDSNFGGWSDPAMDRLLAEGEATLRSGPRAAAYAAAQARLAAASPVWPVAHDLAYGAVSVRLRTDAGPVDPARMTYERGIDGWILAAP